MIRYREVGQARKNYKVPLYCGTFNLLNIFKIHWHVGGEYVPKFRLRMIRVFSKHFWFYSV